MTTIVISGKRAGKTLEALKWEMGILKADNARLREALAWYGDAHNWEDGYVVDEDNEEEAHTIAPIFYDNRGERARNALEGAK